MAIYLPLGSVAAAVGVSVFWVSRWAAASAPPSIHYTSCFVGGGWWQQEICGVAVMYWHHAYCILDLDTVLRRDLFTPAARWRQLTLAGLRCAPCLVTTWRCDGCVTLELWHCDELIAAHCTTLAAAMHLLLFDLHWQLRCLLEDVDEQWTGCQCRYIRWLLWFYFINLIEIFDVVLG